MISILAIAAAVLVPAVASAQTITQVLSLFNVFAGVMLVVGILTFLGGFIGYLVLLGNEKRKEGLFVMVWGLAILFVLAILLGALKMLQGPLSFVIGMAVMIFLLVVIIVSLSKAGGSEPAEHKE